MAEYNGKKYGKSVTEEVREASEEVKAAFKKLDSIPFLERTADGHSVGRCCFYLKNGICERHGDVSQYQKYYRETGKLTDENELKNERT